MVSPDTWSRLGTKTSTNLERNLGASLRRWYTFIQVGKGRSARRSGRSYCRGGGSRDEGLGTVGGAGGAVARRRTWQGPTGGARARLALRASGPPAPGPAWRRGANGRRRRRRERRRRGRRRRRGQRPSPREPGAAAAWPSSPKGGSETRRQGGCHMPVRDRRRLVGGSPPPTARDPPQCSSLRTCREPLPRDENSRNSRNAGRTPHHQSGRNADPKARPRRGRRIAGRRGECSARRRSWVGWAGSPWGSAARPGRSLSRFTTYRIR